MSSRLRVETRHSVCRGPRALPPEKPTKEEDRFACRGRCRGAKRHEGERKEKSCPYAGERSPLFQPFSSENAPEGKPRNTIPSLCRLSTTVRVRRGGRSQKTKEENRKEKSDRLAGRLSRSFSVSRLRSLFSPPRRRRRGGRKERQQKGRRGTGPVSSRSSVRLRTGGRDSGPPEGMSSPSVEETAAVPSRRERGRAPRARGVPPLSPKAKERSPANEPNASPRDPVTCRAENRARATEVGSSARWDPQRSHSVGKGNQTARSARERPLGRIPVAGFRERRATRRRVVRKQKKTV